jgi:hypothetical protein
MEPRARFRRGHRESLTVTIRACFGADLVPSNSFGFFRRGILRVERVRSVRRDHHREQENYGARQSSN